MLTLRSKVKLFVAAVITLIAVDVMVGMPEQSQSNLGTPQRSISITVDNQ